MIAAIHIALLTVLLVALVVPARAQDPSAQSRIKIDTSLFCDTQHQVERFVMHFNGNGHDAEAAINTVNEEMQVEDSCVIATAAYRQAQQVSTVRDEHRMFDVMEVVVVGVYTVNGLEQSLPTELYTLVPREEESGTVGRGHRERQN